MEVQDNESMREEELDGVINHLRNYVDIPIEVDGEMMLTCDSELETSSSLREEDIVDIHVQPEEDTEEVVTPVKVTEYDAFMALDRIKQYVSTHESPQAESFRKILLKRMFD